MSRRVAHQRDGCLARPLRCPHDLTMPHDEPTLYPASAAAGPAGRTHVFVTVGSTRFDTLVQRVLSGPVLEALQTKGYRTMDIQCGHSSFDTSPFQSLADGHWQLPGSLEVNVWRFKPTLKEDYERADLIISHAGEPLSPHGVRHFVTPPRLRHHPRRSQAQEAPHRRPQSHPPRQPSSGALRLPRPPQPPKVCHRGVRRCSLSSRHHPHLAPSPHRDLPHAIDKLDPATLVPFPQFDGSRFREILDEEMGFSHSRENSAGR